MSYRTVILSSFEEYLASTCDAPEDVAEQTCDRNELLLRFPYAVMLQVSFPELDFTDRWCWQQFGPSDGKCMQCQSEYCACPLSEPHSHSGKWTRHWFEKTDYDFGFNEWYFALQADRECFLANVPKINWGENYPK